MEEKLFIFYLIPVLKYIFTVISTHELYFESKITANLHVLTQYKLLQIYVIKKHYEYYALFLLSQIFQKEKCFFFSLKSFAYQNFKMQYY